MRIDILAIGRLRSGPEHELCRDYVARATKAGRSQHIGPIELREIDVKSPVREASANALADVLPQGAITVLLDERGKALTSVEIAEHVARWRDQGERQIVFLIGGADGVTAEFRRTANLLLAFGPQTWPHKLVRVMLCEQIYRAVSVLTGSPYHRE